MFDERTISRTIRMVFSVRVTHGKQASVVTFVVVCYSSP